MKTVRIFEHGKIDKLVYDEISQPNCESSKIKIQIKAASINHLDIWMRCGLPGKTTPLPIILGSDAAGTIVEVGNEISEYKVGDDVVIQPGIFCRECSYCKSGNENYCLEYGILGKTENGTQAEYIVLNPINLHLKPNYLTYEEAASMPLVFMTAYQMLIKRAKLKPNESVLIYGGSSGVGSAAIQISKQLGAKVIATAGNDKKCEYSRKMGAHYTLNHNNDNWLDKVKTIVDNKGVNVVFEHIGSATWKQSLQILAKGGRIITCGATTGSNVNINLAHLFMKQQSIMGSTMSNIQSFYKVMDNINHKIYTPLIDKVFPMKDIRSAHQYIEDRRQMGKVIVVP